MGKIVKYCAACEESFAEKFAFCPNCGQAMTAFEMNPVVKEAPVSNVITPPAAIVEDSAVQTAAPSFVETAPEIETAPVGETIAISANQTQAFSNELIEEDVEEVQLEDTPIEVPPTETKTYAAAAGTNGNNNYYQTTDHAYQTTSDAQADDGGYRITVIEEKNVKQRNLLLLGSMALMLSLALGGTVYSLFNKDLLVGAIDQELGVFVPVVDDEPMDVEEQPKPKDNKDAGGGGGGGKEEQQPASKGRLVSQSENPITPPSVNIPQ
jgi:hypothetical protein